ncbi:LytR/AlgR family response regulator transcription factor [Emticicia agri]|uniref:LytTR family transcriptional regulator n=1 Tax=Emticicia agri TaxID=2492393 RepID=A0A4Q5M4J2_9BACT|nr:LytTR family DNA-binding domain-containing protein [Emticicia agri]RYU97029.1 LytTR family transcriptional regulator [Emticicia agri]
MLKNHTLFSQDILYLKADINYTEFYMNNGKKFTSSFTLKRYAEDERLKDFLRVNKSYLVNRKYIEDCRCRYKDLRIYLTNGDEIKVSRRRRMAVQESLQINTSVSLVD